jgi:fructose-1,6-bisphosphatase II
MKLLGLDLVRATENAAIAASHWIGSGDKLEADKAATEAIRRRLNKMEFCGTIAIGEGKKDKSYGLYHGEQVGVLRVFNDLMPLDIAVDPIEGTRPTVTSGPEAMSVIAVADNKCMFQTEEFYMNKLAFGASIAKTVQLNINDPIERTIQLASLANGKKITDIMVCILDRSRHLEVIARMRQMGVRIKLIQDCDVSGAIAACLPDRGIDLLYGVGGAPEAVLTACAVKCLGGGFQAQLCDKDGNKLDDKVYKQDDLVVGHCVFAATGITDGSLLKGCRFSEFGPITNSVFMRSESGTIRWMQSYHGN